MSEKRCCYPGCTQPVSNHRNAVCCDNPFHNQMRHKFTCWRSTRLSRNPGSKVTFQDYVDWYTARRGGITEARLFAIEKMPAPEIEYDGSGRAACSRCPYGTEDKLENPFCRNCKARVDFLQHISYVPIPNDIRHIMALGL